MGAGYCFLNQEIPDGIYHVDGEPASLRAEAAAMYKVLVAARGSTRLLVVLCDSLGLLQLLKGFRKRDYVYHPDVTAHFNLIELILQELNKRKAGTILVKVKSHVGVELNEKADELAKAGLTAEDNVEALDRLKWPLWVADTSNRPMHKTQLFRKFKQAHFKAQHQVWTWTAGVTTWQFTTPGLAQRFYS